MSPSGPFARELQATIAAKIADQRNPLSALLLSGFVPAAQGTLCIIPCRLCLQSKAMVIALLNCRVFYQKTLEVLDYLIKQETP